MLVNRMMDAWKNRQEVSAQPAGASPLDEVYLDAIVGGSADSIDVFSLGCTSSLPQTVSGCSTSSHCTA